METAATDIYTYCPTLSLPDALPICATFLLHSQARPGITAAMSDSTKNSKPKSDRAYEKKRRSCLMCSSEFVSSWPGERVRQSSKSTRDWREGLSASASRPTQTEDRRRDTSRPTRHDRLGRQTASRPDDTPRQHQA